ncbi:MAG: hypothetical protein CL681_29175, partial [Blastopirellula sp.]|nr:hypothetical protein [Blastopirellula sp.]
MKVTNIYVIPDTGTYKGGKLFDRWGNLSYFADVTGLEESDGDDADSTYSVKAHTRLPYMRAKGSMYGPVYVYSARGKEYGPFGPT